MWTCDCGKQVEGARGARGHIQFTNDDQHGEQGEVPDDWKEMFEQDATDAEVSEAVADAEQDADQDDAEQPDAAGVQDTDAEGESTTGRLRKALFEDVTYLWD